jgi:uncharacterized membrane protein
MSEFSTHVRIDAPADEVFAYVTDFDNMPDYLPMVDKARPEGEGRIRLEGSGAKGQKFDNVAWFQTHEFNRTMLWGATGANDYAGDLEVMDQGDACELTINVKFESLPELSQEERERLKAQEPQIQNSLEESANRIKAACERSYVPTKERARGYAI